MPVYTFMEDGCIRSEDVRRLIDLTCKGVLRWQPSSNGCALTAYPISQGAKDDAAVSTELVGANLKGTRLGYNPQTSRLHYLRLTDHDGRQHYIEEGSGDELLDLGNQLYSLVQKAVRLGGTISAGAGSPTRYCDECKKETEHKHLHSAPYGLDGATMAGSERYTCVVCEYSEFVGS